MIVNANDYYPFGSGLSGRKYTNEKVKSYRYGFNGQERTDEVSGDGNSYDFGARMYDARLGRWMSTEPLQRKYPMFSPYHFAANNPIVFVDPDGRIIKVATQEGQEQTLAILKRAFGDKASGFSFNENNELVFTGDPSAFKGKEAEVFNGLNQVMTSTVVTNIVYEKNRMTNEHGGEATITTTDNPV